MNNTVYIFVNGILTEPEDVKGWTDRAVIWINRNVSFKSDKMEYESGLVSRRWFQNDRVKNLQRICKMYSGEKIVLVGHSNGCDIIERAVRSSIIGAVHELHLIGAASEHDFVKNDYNRVLKNGRVDKIFVYVSSIDEALQKAKFSKSLFGWAGLGYGYLGLVGPSRVDPLIKDKVVVYNELMSHSQWFSRKNFENTMQTITGLKYV